MTIRKLNNSDRPAIEAFLSRRLESSMFLLSNIRRSGLEFDDKPFHADYYGSLSDDGRVTGILAHCWNGNILIQAPDRNCLRDILEAFKRDGARNVAGILGPSAQAAITIDELGLQAASYDINVDDGLFALDLAQLQTGSDRGDSGYRILNVSDVDPALIGAWLKGFEIEALGKDDDAGLAEAIADRIVRLAEWRDLWVLSMDGVPVAMSGFSARLPEIVQVGAVWTPLGHRNRGYARMLVTATLCQARDGGVERAVLFANNPAAIPAYEAIGFKRTDNYQIAMLKRPISVR